MNWLLAAVLVLSGFVAGEAAMLLVLCLVDRIKAPTHGAPDHAEPEEEPDAT